MYVSALTDCLTTESKIPKQQQELVIRKAELCNLYQIFFFKGVENLGECQQAETTAGHLSRRQPDCPTATQLDALTDFHLWDKW